MEKHDFQKEENYQEYERLLSDPSYKDVRYDTASGGVSAVHVDHYYDKQKSPFGYPRGQYELDVVDILRKQGHRIVLESERPETGIKHTDGYLDDTSMDIKAVESSGRWSIRTKLYEAGKQGAECIVLYFPDKSLYSEERLAFGWETFVSDPNASASVNRIKQVVVLVEKDIIHLNKKTTPSAGW